jgi:hypothetical protein
MALGVAYGALKFSDQGWRRARQDLLLREDLEQRLLGMGQQEDGVGIGGRRRSVTLPAGTRRVVLRRGDGVRKSIAPEAAGSSAAPAAENRPADLAAERKVAAAAHRCLAAAARKPAASAAPRTARSASPDPAPADRGTSGESRHRTAETNRPCFAQARALAPPARKPAVPAVVRKPADQVGARKSVVPAAARRPAGRVAAPDSSAAVAWRPSDWRADWPRRTKAATTNSRRQSAISPAPRRR